MIQKNFVKIIVPVLSLPETSAAKSLKEPLEEFESATTTHNEAIQIIINKDNAKIIFLFKIINPPQIKLNILDHKKLIQRTNHNKLCSKSHKLPLLYFP